MEKILELITEETYVISDHHFRHKNINKYNPIRLKELYEKTKFESVDQMMIHYWNETVKPTDTVLYLGDFAFSEVDKLMKKLNGRKIFIYGNHDKGRLSTEYIPVKGLYIEWNDTYLINPSEDKLYSGIIKKFRGKTIMFTHYPLKYEDPYDAQKEKIVNRITKLNGFYEEFGCDFLIHGHIHGKVKKEVANHFDVSCESLLFKPIKIKDILNKLNF